MIYCFQAGEIGYKLGYTSGSVRKRMVSVQHGCPVKLTLFFEVPGDLSHEQALHAHLERHRLRAEWYRPSAGEVLERCKEASYRAEVYASTLDRLPDQLYNFGLISNHARRPENRTLEFSKAHWQSFKQTAKLLGMPAKQWIIEVLERAASDLPIDSPR